MSPTAVTAESVCTIIASVLPRSSVAGGVSPAMSLQADLGIDSVGLMSLIFVLEEQTGVDTLSRLDRFIEAEYVSDIVAVVCDGQAEGTGNT